MNFKPGDRVIVTKIPIYGNHPINTNARLILNEIYTIGNQSELSIKYPYGYIFIKETNNYYLIPEYEFIKESEYKFNKDLEAILK